MVGGQVVTERSLAALQRVTALILAPLVITHLVLIVIAIRDGLTAGEILNRTQGSIGWALFYGVFVLVASVHAPIGVRTILIEWGALPRPLANGVAVCLGVLLLLAGARAVYAVIGGPG